MPAEGDRQQTNKQTNKQKFSRCGKWTSTGSQWVNLVETTDTHLIKTTKQRERELRKEGREVPSRVRLREGPIGVRITLGQPTIG